VAATLRWLIRVAIVAALFVAVGMISAWLRRPGPVLYSGGPILTMDADGRVVEALAVDGERIAAAGTRAELAAWADQRRARIVDLGGRALLPGFVDAHGHFPGEGLEAMAANLNSPPIGDVRNLDGLLARLRVRARETPSGDWVVGFGYDDTLLAEKRHPTRVDLDRVSGDHPVAAMHISGHLAAVNSAGLATLGFDRASPDPEGGIVRRGPDGEPDGVLEETAMEPIQQHIANPSPLGALRMLRLAVHRALANGVTTAQSGYAGALEIRMFPWLARLGLLPLRLVVWPGDEASAAILAGELSVPSVDPLRVRYGATKLVADGSIQGYTGYLSQPYHVPPGDDPAYRGYARIPREALFEKVARYHAAGRQLAMHGNGDASIEDILDAYQAAQRAHPRADARPIVIHAQMTRPEQLDRMRELGVVPSFFSLHTYYWGDRHRDIFMGPERAARMSPAATALAKGVRFTIHCDAPVVPMEPLRLVWSAVNRRSTSGAAIGPAERITVWQALRAVTIDAAWQHFEEADKGSLEAGKLADLVILDRSPLDVPPAEIDGLQVLETIVGGRTVYRAGG
jgi:predicted amidohydrolase YtcJ